MASFHITPQVNTMAIQTNTQRPACQKVQLIHVGETLNCTESHGSHSTGLAIAIAASWNLDINADSRQQLSIAVAWVPLRLAISNDLPRHIYRDHSCITCTSYIWQYIDCLHWSPVIYNLHWSPVIYNLHWSRVIYSLHWSPVIYNLHWSPVIYNLHWSVIYNVHWSPVIYC